MLFAYLSPDTFYVISAPLAAGLGTLLAFWPWVKSFPKRMWRKFTGRTEAPAPAVDIVTTSAVDQPTESVGGFAP